MTRTAEIYLETKVVVVKIAIVDNLTIQAFSILQAQSALRYLTASGIMSRNTPLTDCVVSSDSGF